MARNWLSSLISYVTRQTGTVRRQPFQRTRLVLEQLEQRLAPAVYDVIGAGDGQEFVLFVGHDGTAANPYVAFTLRSAVDAANANPGSNTIEFDPAVFNGGQIIGLTGGRLELTNSVNIQGPASGVTISGINQFRVFLVDAGVTANLTDLAITGGNAGDANGGGIYNKGTLTLSSCYLSFNTAASGGGLINYGTATLSPCTVENNTATNGGGLFNAFAATATLSHCTVDINSAGVDGGGLDNAGSIMTLSTCTVYGNGATGSGGGIFNEELAALTMIGSTLWRNTANGDGGGLDNAGTATLLDCTMAENAASRGGGTANEFSPISSLFSMTLTNCTVADNSVTATTVGFANAGGGIASDGNPVILANTIVAGNVNGLNGPHDVACIITANFCLIETIGAQFSLSSADNITGQDPLLAGLGTYGGPTQTMTLLPGSPALGQGSVALAVDDNGNPLATDQRGGPFARIANGTVDIGADEANQTFVVSDTTDESDGNYSPGHLSLREAVQLANSDPGADTIAFDPTIFKADPTITLGGGQLELSDAVSIRGPASGVTISGNNQSRVFLIDGGVTATLTNLTITGGNAGVYDGGGINNEGTLSLSGCTVSGNTGVNGGGLINNGMATLTGCTVANNTAADRGGGIDNTGTLTLTNSTVARNSANQGGGLAHFGVATLSDCTVAGNSADQGGGIANGGNLTLANTIVAGNVNVYSSTSTIPDDIEGPVLANFSLIESTTGTTFSARSANDITGKDPLLAPYNPQNHTYALLPGSPAIDHGANALAVGANGKALTSDQRGFARKVGTSVDIGADEYQYDLGISLAPLPTTVVSGGYLDYIVTVVNHGPDAAGSAVVTLPLPAGTSQSAWVASQAGWRLTTMILAGHSVPTATLLTGQTLATAASATFTLAVQVTATQGTISDAATVALSAWDTSATGKTTPTVSTQVLPSGSSKPLPAPTALSPSGTVATQTPTFQWSAVTGARPLRPVHQRPHRRHQPRGARSARDRTVPDPECLPGAEPRSPV